ncbi:lipid-A-disaccharide synthase N-terminal domain-containing protein, partial [Candidatus Woesebacteria bacterium]|nr:lipid-A-disaccharide synthase N-terminal domain-containing protein [Candidatus Woesebacteria bacterium]
MSQFHIDIWTLWGLTAQGFYFARFVLQWFHSEKQGKIV